MKIEKLCSICNMAFIAKNEKQQFCSNTCRGKGRSIGKYETAACENCGKEFFRSKKSINKSTGLPIRFCSRKCGLNAASTQFKIQEWRLSENNPFNNSDIQEKARITRNKNYKEHGRIQTSPAPKLLSNAYEKFKETYKNDVEFLFTVDEYKGYNHFNRYKFRCVICKNEFEDDINSQNKPRCLICFPINDAISKSWLQKSYYEMKTKYENDVIFLFTVDEYTGSTYPNKYNFQCVSCASVFESKMSGGNPPRCLICKPRQNTSEALLQKAYIELQKKYKNVVIFKFPINEYKGTNQINKYAFECVVCQKQFLEDLSAGLCPICPQCFPKNKNQSIFELEIKDYIVSIIGKENIIEKDITVLSGKKRELDIYCPSYKFAVECDGNYWHSELRGADKKYHLSKTEECESQGIQLLHIFESEWKFKQPIIKSIIQTKLKPTNNIRFAARKCIIQEIDSATSNIFLDANHLQGKDHASIRIGLFYNNELLQIMTFCKPRYNKNIKYELSRAATKLYTTVIGGTEKLWKYFITKYTPNSVITYSDRRFFTGNSYSKLGFVFESFTSPAYYYFQGTRCYNLYNRIAFQKHKLQNIFPEVFDINKTEWEIMQMANYNRIWDCGNRRFVWKQK